MTRSVFNHRRGGPRYPAEVLADNPLLYWRLDETSGTNVVDYSGNGRTGTYTPGTLGTITLGQTSALPHDADTSITVALSATNGWIGSAASTAFDTTSVSGEIWVNPTSGQVNKHGVIFHGPSPGTGRWYFRINPTTGEVEIVAASTLLTGQFLNFNTWTHVVVTFDNSDSKWRLYRNGSLIYTSGASGLAAVTNKPIYIGKNNGTSVGGETFVGGLDEVAIYGTALSATRIAVHYNAA